MLEGQRVVDTPQLDDRAVEDHHIDNHRERRPDHRGDQNRQRQRLGHMRMHPAVTLARHGGIAFLAQPEPLGIKRTQRETQQNNRQHRRLALIVLRADNGKEDLGAQHIEISAQHQGVAKIGHGFDEPQQESVRQPGPHQRQRHCLEHLPLGRAQGLRRLFHRRADALDHPDQHQERDGRERQRLRDQHPRQPVKPPGRLYPEQVGEEHRHRARQAKQQDQRQTDHKRRRDDRQNRQRPQCAFVAKARSRHHQRKDQSQDRGDKADQHRQEQGIPRHATATAAQAAQPPQPVVKEFGHEHSHRIAAIIGDEGRRQHLGDGKEYKDRDNGNHTANGADDEHVAIDRPARRDALREHKQEGRRHDQPAIPHAELAVTQLAENLVHPGEIPAAYADGKALNDQPAKAKRSGQNQDLAI